VGDQDLTRAERGETPERAAQTMIRLEHLSKRFPGIEAPAVDDLTLEVPEGEIVILVGPSGCGKTTTMKMVNRLIEPTSGRIFLEGEDVTSVNPDQLRRRIGYVIQQIGLFPHLTIHDNIATVPKLLGWDRQRIDQRVDELLETVGMDPDAHRDRYPKELSGGQRQRVGVARAMSADPEVMLMDEPFGAIDPITRERLQDEFLRVQADIKKTIVFVTHDIEEAIKMGDRIAIMRQNSHIAQYDTPERILTAPADEFVSDFIGSGAALKRLTLSRVRDIELSPWPAAPADAPLEQLRSTLRESDKDAFLLLDGEHRPVRWVNAHDLQRVDGQRLTEVGVPPEAVLEPQARLSDALNGMITAPYGCAVVVDASGAYQGAVDFAAISAATRRMRLERHDRADRDDEQREEVTT
jgi:osmoprotectant transport system ATP-binding protein